MCKPLQCSPTLKQPRRGNPQLKSGRAPNVRGVLHHHRPRHTALDEFIWTTDSNPHGLYPKLKKKKVLTQCLIIKKILWGIDC